MKKILKNFFIKIKLYPLDIVILLFILFITAFIYRIPSNFEGYSNKPTVMIQYEGEKKYYPLDQNQDIYLKQNKIHIKIENKEVWIIESDCLNQICVLTGKIKKPGQTVICVPNKLIIRIVGTVSEQYDSINY